MGYTIEISFNILKQSSVTKIQDKVKNLAVECGCQYLYDDYEVEMNVQYKRNNCIMTVNFCDTNITYFIYFLKYIKSVDGLNIETIYDDLTNMILYASKYYQTQKMNKGCAKDYQVQKRKRSYSEDDTMILNVVK